MRAQLLPRVREILGRAGYYLSVDADVRPLAFDLAARRDSQLLIVKVLTNVDGLSEPVAQELRVIADFLNAAPVVVGERSSARQLEDGAVYIRYGVPILTFGTLEEYLVEGDGPLVYAAPGGFYVQMDGPRLRALREQRGISLGELAAAAGVSRRAIGMYEEGMGAMVEVAARLEEFLGEALVVPIDPFSPRRVEAVAGPAPLGGGFEGGVLRTMEGLGFRVAPTTKSPFAAIMKEESVVLTAFAASGPGDPERRAAALSNLSEVTEAFGVFFVERTTTRVAIEGTPVISREELLRIEAPDALLRLIHERRGQRR